MTIHIVWIKPYTTSTSHNAHLFISALECILDLVKLECIMDLVKLECIMDLVKLECI